MDIREALARRENDKLKELLLNQLKHDLTRKAEMRLSIELMDIRKRHVKAMIAESEPVIESFIKDFNMVEELETIAAESFEAILKQAKEQALERLKQNMNNW